jgi:hypothetical protein
VRGAREAPAAPYRNDLFAAQGGIRKIASAAVETTAPDPLGDAAPLHFEQLVEIPNGDVIRIRNPGRVEVRIAEVLVDEALCPEKQLR